MSHSERFRISTALLQDGPTVWANLGLWQPVGMDYVSAARALADRHWQLASPAAGSRILDAGCGYGASLHYWRELDSSLQLTGLECQKRCLQHLRNDGWCAVEGYFDRTPLPMGLPIASQDTMVCVDAAYHATSLQHFARFASLALRPGGVLVFSTLMPAQALKASTRWLLRMADIPISSVVHAAQLQKTLETAGFQLEDVMNLSAEGEGVLQGFAAYTRRRAVALPLSARFSLDWLKIAATGRLCATLDAQHGLRYVLVRAKRN